MSFGLAFGLYMGMKVLSLGSESRNFLQESWRTKFRGMKEWLKKVSLWEEKNNKGTSCTHSFIKSCSFFERASRNQNKS
jgi:hypothetical protein